MNIQNDMLYIVLVLFILVAVLWLQSYVRRYFRFIAGRERIYIDANTILVIGDYIRLYIFLFAGIASVWILSFASEVFVNIWQIIAEYFPAVIGILATVSIATVLLQCTYRYISYISGELHVKPKTTVSEKNAHLLGLLIKYTLIIIAISIVLVFVLSIIGRRETIFAAFAGFFSANAIYIAFMIVIVIIVFVVDEGIGMFLEDLKTHTRTFTPQIISLLRGGIQYGLYSLAWLLIIYVVLMMVKMENLGAIVIAIYFVIIIFILIIFIASTIKHASAGIVLMSVNPFSKGDTIKVGDIEGDVVETNLFVTKVKDVHEEILTIPNTRLINQTIHNFSRVKKYGISIKIEFDFEIPHKTVERVLINAAKEVPGIVKDPEPFVRCVEIRGSKILYELIAFTTGERDEEIVRSYLINAVQDAILASDMYKPHGERSNGCR